MKFIRYMAIAEAKRKDCPKCNFGEYNQNKVVCDMQSRLSPHHFCYADRKNE